jgi:hypothetical protein
MVADPRFQSGQRMAAAFLALMCVSNPVTAETVIHFEDNSSASGIEFRHGYGAEELSNLVQTTGPGICLFDADSDGDLDLYFVNGAPVDGFGDKPALTNALYLNDGAGHFRDGTSEAGVGDAGTGMAAVAADYDNDGDFDLYVCNFGANIFYQNQGDGTFKDVTVQSGVACNLWSAAASFADVNADGHVDLFVSNYLDFHVGDQPRRSMLSYKEGYRFFPGPYDFTGVSNSLFINQGNGTFRDSTEESGIQRIGKGMGSTFSDLDLDGDVDLMVANDRHQNFLYENDGDGHFTEASVKAEVAFDMNGFETGAMGVATGDVDGDGYPDMLITNMIFEYNTLYMNRRDMTFEDVTERVALHEGSHQTVGWGVNLWDFDRDGDLDAFMSNGHVQDYIDTFSESIGYAQANLLFANDGGGQFREIGASAGVALDVMQVSRGSACGDLDGDELADIVVVNSNDFPQILRNTTESPGNWLRLQLHGVQSNRSGLGAKIRVTASGRTIMREVYAGNSYASQSELWPRFGLGSAETVERLEIEWLGGTLDVYTDIPVNNLFYGVEGTGLRLMDATEFQWTPEEAS